MLSMTKGYVPISGKTLIITKYDELMLLWCPPNLVRVTRCFELWVNWAIGQAWLSDTGLLSEKNRNSYPDLRNRVPSTFWTFTACCWVLTPQTSKQQNPFNDDKVITRAGGKCLVICLKCRPCGCQVSFLEIKLSRCHSRDDQFIAHMNNTTPGAAISLSTAFVKCWLIVWDVFYCLSPGLRGFSVRVIN